MRYSAYISYNHRDKKAAQWLHRALETYRIPKRLRGRETGLGVLGARIPPVFRDRDELAANTSLAGSVREALEQSYSLIVICSPNGARSKWVNEEIRTFTALGRRHQVQCLIIDGVSHASSTPGADPTLECLPPALFEHGADEPLAADIRPGRDSRSAAVLKLLAGIMGVPYDELRQREQARRQQRLAIAASVLGAGFVVTSGLAITAYLERNEAVRQRDIARRKTLTAERTVSFVKSMFEVADPSEARGDTITAREILDRGAVQIDRDLNDEPSVKAELGTTLGEVYGGLGLYQRSEEMVRKGLTLPNVDGSTRARQYLALGDAEVRRGEYGPALAAYDRALHLARDPRSPREDLVSRILVGIGEAQSESDQTQDADRNIRAALAIDTRMAGPASPEVARDLETLGPNQIDAGRLYDARKTMERALAIRMKTQGALHPRTAEDLTTLGAIAYLQHDSVAAENYYGRALDSYKVVLGPDHPEMVLTMNNLALLKVERRDFHTAEPLLEHVVEITVKQSSDSYPDLAFYYENLGRAKRGLGEDVAAQNLFLKALRVARIRKHRNLAPILVDLADLACAHGDTATGFARLAEARPIMAATYPKDPWRTAWVDVVQGGCLLAAHRRREALPLLETGDKVLRTRWSPTSIYGARSAQLLARARAG
jgi:tetratricopeptide (TPR) repeat protein